MITPDQILHPQVLKRGRVVKSSKLQYDWSINTPDQLQRVSLHYSKLSHKVRVFVNDVLRLEVRVANLLKFECILPNSARILTKEGQLCLIVPLTTYYHEAQKSFKDSSISSSLTRNSVHS
jgi:hypothetical protein